MSQLNGDFLELERECKVQTVLQCWKHVLRAIYYKCKCQYRVRELSSNPLGISWIEKLIKLSQKNLYIKVGRTSDDIIPQIKKNRFWQNPQTIAIKHSKLSTKVKLHDLISENSKR